MHSNILGTPVEIYEPTVENYSIFFGSPVVNDLKKLKEMQDESLHTATIPQ